jgi:Raf kinase inhibitor-like YbhB/YbcL family protein
MLIIVSAAAALLSACATGGLHTPAFTASVTESAQAAASPCSQPSSGSSEIKKEMTVESPGIVEGYIDPAYGIHGKYVKNGIPLLSIPLEIKNAPQGAECFAVLMDDTDSVPLCGYRWVHWMAADVADSSLPAGFSSDAGSKAIQGKNGFGTVGYGGPAPQDKDHTYVITVYALDGKTGLKDGFSKGEFMAAIEGHVLAQAVIEGIYKK